MARKKHSDEPAKKKASKKKSAKKKAGKKVGKSLLERAAAKKRSKAAADTMAPTLTRPSTRKNLEAEVVLAKDGEHPVDTLANARAKTRKLGGTIPRSPIEDERAEFRSGPLTEDTIADICRMLRFSVHRQTAERLLGLSSGRIKKWIRRGKECREAIEAWHEHRDDLVQEGAKPAAFKKLGPEPELDIYGLLHACVLNAEAHGEKTAVGGIVDAAMGAGERPPDWKANAWLLSRRYGKRWGSYAEREMTEEEDHVDGSEGNRRSAVDRLSDVLEDMFGKKAETEP